MDVAAIARLRNRRTGRLSSWDTTGRNDDAWSIPAGASRVLADIRGPGVITHLWMTQGNHYRECLIRITWDDAPRPSVLCPLGDFFCLGHGMVNSFQSLLFTASTSASCELDRGCALNCYVPMPFRKRALIELVNESPAPHRQYFYVDHERCAAADLGGLGYFHAEFRRTNPFGGWAPEITVNTPHANAVNAARTAWDNNYVILDTRGRGHYIGCNLSVTNFQGTWWGEGDDMIWVDGYKWPPDLHGTGSEDYLNQAWGMQPNAFLRNGSSIFEGHTLKGLRDGRPGMWAGQGGYQTSYVFHLENPVRFRREIKVTIEHGHANHLANEMSSVAYWYAARPAAAVEPPPVARRLPVRRDELGQWIHDPERQCPGKPVRLTAEMKALKEGVKRDAAILRTGRLSPRHSAFIAEWQVSRLMPPCDIAKAPAVGLGARAGWKTRRFPTTGVRPWLVNIHALHGADDGLIYLANRFRVARDGEWTIHVGHDGPARLFVDGKAVLTAPGRVNPAPYLRSAARVRLSAGVHEIVVALDTDEGYGWGLYLCFEAPDRSGAKGAGPVFPVRVPTTKSTGAVRG